MQIKIFFLHTKSKGTSPKENSIIITALRECLHCCMLSPKILTVSRTQKWYHSWYHKWFGTASPFYTIHGFRIYHTSSYLPVMRLMIIRLHATRLVRLTSNRYCPYETLFLYINITMTTKLVSQGFESQMNPECRKAASFISAAHKQDGNFASDGLQLETNLFFHAILRTPQFACHQKCLFCQRFRRCTNCHRLFNTLIFIGLSF